MKNIATFLTATYLLLLAAGCSLKEDRESFADRENSYRTVFQAESVVKSCYADIHQIFNSSSAMMMEVASDLWYQETSIVDAISAISPSRSGQAERIWRYCYNGIMRANEAIECITASDIDEDARQYLQAEARVLRAFFYYYLTNTFNGVPYYKCMVKDMADLEMIRSLPRTDAGIIRADLYTDLKENAIPCFTVANGLKRRTCEVRGNRAGYALGLMLMAKFAMWNRDWSLALEPLAALEELYGPLSETRYPLDETVWWKKNTAESIFEVQHEWKADGIKFYSTACTNMYPVISSDGTLDGVPMPRWGTQLSSHTCARTSYHYAAFRPAKGTSMSEVNDARYTNSIFRPLPLTYGKYNESLNRYEAVIDLNALETGRIRGEKIDRRVLYVLGLGDMETGETFGNVKKYGYAYGGMKFWIPDRTANYDSNNYKIFRYADAVLMSAECLCMKGEYDKALGYISMVRTRAGVDTDMTLSDEESVMQLIRDERARELGGELHRRFDLVRWGIWYSEIMKHQNSSATIMSYIRPYHQYYPIPDSQCALSGYILDNPEYADAENEDGDFEEDNE